MTFETRTVAAEFDMRDDTTTGAPVFEGYASVFNQPYDMGPFWEQVDRRAFDRTLSLGPDVRLLIDHEGQPLARTKSGTLTLRTDDHGLHVHAPLDPSDPDVQRLLPKMRRGDLSEMSFAFRVPTGGDEWDYSTDRTMRTLRELSLQGGDVSVVTYPASPTTSASLRSKDLREARCVFIEQAARSIREGRSLSPENLAKLRAVLDEVLPASEAPEVAEAIEEQQAQPVARGRSLDLAKRLMAAADARLGQ